MDNGTKVEREHRLQEQQEHLYEVEYGVDATDKREAKEQKARIQKVKDVLAERGLSIQPTPRS